MTLLNINVFFVQSLFERQGLALHGALHPALEKAHMQLPKSMARTKSFGNSSGIFYIHSSIKLLNLK